MSTRRGAAKKGAPKHQNTFAFKHNTNSRKTAKIASINHHGLCKRCQDKIDWRKKYRKYKPLKAPATCVSCKRRNVNRAYHTLCDECRKEKSVCAWCSQAPPIDDEAKDGEDPEALIERLEEGIPGMRERDRRAALRKLYKEVDGEDSDDIGSDGEGETGAGAEAGGGGGEPGGGAAGAGSGGGDAADAPVGASAASGTAGSSGSATTSGAPAAHDSPAADDDGAAMR